VVTPPKGGVCVSTVSIVGCCDGDLPNLGHGPRATQTAGERAGIFGPNCCDRPRSAGGRRRFRWPGFRRSKSPLVDRGRLLRWQFCVDERRCALLGRPPHWKHCLFWLRSAKIEALYL